MKPHSFDAETSRGMVGDARARVIEAKARADADKGKDGYSPPECADGSYWAKCKSEFERSVYHAQFARRLERNERKATVES